MLFSQQHNYEVPDDLTVVHLLLFDHDREPV